MAPWKTAYRRFNVMRRAGLTRRLLELSHARLGTKALIDADPFHEVSPSLGRRERVSVACDDGIDTS